MVDKGILPGIMPARPAAKNSVEFPHLEREPFCAICPPDKVLINSQVILPVPGIEPPIRSNFRKRANIVSRKCVQKQGETRIEKDLFLSKNEAWGMLIEVEGLNINESSDLKLPPCSARAKDEGVRYLIHPTREIATRPMHDESSDTQKDPAHMLQVHACANTFSSA